MKEFFLLLFGVFGLVTAHKRESSANKDEEKENAMKRRLNDIHEVKGVKQMHQICA
jgi:hypothetical protein